MKGQASCEMRLILFNDSLYIHPQSSHRDLNKKDWIGNLLEILRGIKRMGLSLPNVDFLVTTPDRPVCKGPAFSYSRSRFRSDSKIFMIPYPTWDRKSLGKRRQAIYRANEQNSWHGKKDQAFWRGSSTGIRRSSPEIKNALRKSTGSVQDDLQIWHNVTRFRLLLMTRDDPRFNVSLSKIYAETPSHLRPALEQFLTGPCDNIAVASEFKYVLDVEGNSFSDRARDLMGIESVLLKQEYPFVDFLSMGLQPWIHYLPIKSDLEDLMAVLDFAMHHDESMRVMAEEKAEWSRYYITLDLPIVYTYHLLMRYHHSQDFTVTLPPLSKLIKSI